MVVLTKYYHASQLLSKYPKAKSKILAWTSLDNFPMGITSAVTLATTRLNADIIGKDTDYLLTSAYRLTFVSCKHGLPAPPKKPKEKAPISIMSDDHKETGKVKKTGSSVQRLHKKTLANDEKKLNDLQKYHDNASVSQSLGLPTGQRLKLEPPTTVPAATLKKPKQPANYELSFTDLGESPMLSSGMLLDDAELDCDDDEPPESVAQYLA